MNRRNVLVGLGTIVAGGGAALGTGAFSSVEATRTVKIDTAGDGGALLGLAVDGALAGGSNDVIEFSLEADINVDAVTRFSDTLTITNNDDEQNSEIGALEVAIEDSNENNLLVNNGSIAEGSGLNFVDTDNSLSDTNTLTLQPGEEATLDVVFEFTGVKTAADDDIPGTIVIEATPPA